MSERPIYLIGPPRGLPPSVQSRLAARQVHRLDQAALAVAVQHQDQWSNAEWAELRRAHQDHRVPTFAVHTDGDGRYRRPSKPWPGSRWQRGKSPGSVPWWQLQTDPTGFQPGHTRVLFPGSPHFGKTLDEVPLAYLDWLLGQDWLDQDSFLGRMVRLVIGKMSRADLQPLERESFDTQGFVPTEGRVKARRSPVAAQADEEFISQRLLILSRLEGLERQARNRVIRWHRLEEEEARRVGLWLRALDAIDRIQRAEDEGLLDLYHHKATWSIELLATVENSQEVADELHRLADAEAGRRRHYLTEHGPDWVAIRAHEVIRWMRGCSSPEDLLDVVSWILPRRDGFDEDALKALRNAYLHHLRRVRPDTATVADDNATERTTEHVLVATTA